MNKIHSTAIIGKDVELGNNISIGAYCVLEGKISIEDDCILHNNITINGKTTIGKKNELYPNSVIGTDPQDLKYLKSSERPETEVIIGDENIVRECVTLNRGAEYTYKSVIGSNNLFMAYSHIGHDCRIGSGNVFANSVAIAGHVEIDDNAILGGLVGVHQKVRIGSYVMVGAASMVVKDIPPFALYSGNPLDYSGLNRVGLQRRGFTTAEIDEIKFAYKLLMQSNLNTSQAVAKMKEIQNKSTHLEYLIEFIEKTQRGISK